MFTISLCIYNESPPLLLCPVLAENRHSHSHSHSHNHPPHHHHHYHHPNSFNIRATSKKIDYNSNNQLCRSEKSSSIKIQTREARSVAEEASRIAAAIRIQAAFRGFLVCIFLLTTIDAYISMGWKEATLLWSGFRFINPWNLYRHFNQINLCKQKKWINPAG